MTIRELITRLKFKVDEKNMREAEHRIQTFKRIGMVAAAGIVTAIGGIGFAAIKSAANFEMLNTQFEVLLGNAPDANALMASLKTFAARTPFQLEDLARSTQVLLAFGIESERVMPSLRMLGDVAMGNREKMRLLTLAFSQIQSTGRLMGQDLLQLINAGFNPLTIISERTGRSMMDLKDAMSRGEIGADMVTEAFRIATSEGGRFFKGMEKGSKTLLGIWSTLKDVFTLTVAEIGNVILPILKKYINQLIAYGEVVKKWVIAHRDDINAALMKVVDIFKTVIGYIVRFGKIAWAVLSSPYGKIILGLVVALKSLSIILGVVSVATALWNALLTANPIGLIIVAIAGLIAIIRALVGNWDWLITAFRVGTEWLKKIFDAVVEYVSALWAYIKDDVMALLDSLWELGKTLFAFIKELFPLLQPVLKLVLIPLMLLIKILPVVMKLMLKYINFMVRLVTHIVDLIRIPIEKLVTWLKGIFEWLIDKLGFIGKWVGKLIGVGADLVAGKEAEDKKSLDKIIQQNEKTITIQKEIDKTQRAITVQQQNKFDIHAPLLPDGRTTLTPGGVKKSIQDAVHAAFSIELKKVLISSG